MFRRCIFRTCHAHGAGICVFLCVPVVDVFRNIGKQFSANVVGCAVEDDKIHGHLMIRKKCGNGIDGDTQCLVFRITVNAGGDQRKRYRFAMMFPCKEKGFFITGNKQFPLAVIPAVPDGADRVDDVFA